LTLALFFAASIYGRVELNVHHVGEYAAVPWEKADAEIKPGSRADRVRDLNFSVASINLRDDLPEEFFQRWRAAPKEGKVFLPRVQFWDGPERVEGTMRDIEVYWKRLDRFLSAMPLDKFQGIVLSEENVSYGGRPEVLTELYRRIKTKYDIPVWQWWSPSSSVPESGGWIPADGWVIDPYFMPKPEFRRFVRKYLVTGLPLVIMPWASTGEKAPPMTPEKWKANTDQLDVAVEFNLPVAFYWTYGRGTGGTSCHFGCNRGQLTTEWDKINQWVWDYTARARALPADYTGLPSANLADARVIEIGPRFAYRDDFSTARCIDDASMTGFRDLVMDGKTLSTRGFRGRPANATLLYHFAGDYPLHHPTVSLDGRAEIALSADGKDWSHRGTTSCSAPFAGVREFWARISLKGAVRVDNLRIGATVPPPKDTTVTLNRPVYEDDFRTEKYLFTTQRTGDDKLEWSEGQLAVRLRPGGSKPELIWRFKTSKPVRHIVVEATGRANNGSLGTNHFLDISPDGKKWLHETSTVGRSVNRSGWAAHGLRIELSDDPRFQSEFYVRIRMKAQSHKEIHRSLSGIVNKLTVSAS
jgi:hypothetical protein